MDVQYIIDSFFEQCMKSSEVWLLQASDGMFALVEDNEGVSILPMYADREAALAAATGEWSDYKPEPMPMRELIQWLTEMAEDDMYVGIACDGNEVIPFSALSMQQEFILRKRQSLN